VVFFLLLLFTILTNLIHEVCKHLYQIYVPPKKDSLFVEGSPVKVNFLNVLTRIKENYDFIYALSQSSYLDFRKFVRGFTLHALDDTPNAKEHIIADFQVPYKYGLEIFIATIESVIVTWLESGAKEDPIEIATIILSISDFTSWN